MIDTIHIVVCRKPTKDSFVDNAVRHDAGSINIDASRVPIHDDSGVWGTSNSTINSDRMFNASPEMHEYQSRQHSLGRFPTNVILQDSDMVRGCFSHTKSGKPGVMRVEVNRSAAYGAESRKECHPMVGDEGSSARFFWSYDD